nr:ABC transporter ATP-binding protein [Microvirga puerhi]
MSVRDLTVAFGGTGKPVPVVRGISFDVFANEVFCIVGESGSGKSVTSLAVSGLLPETADVSGSIVIGDTEIVGASAAVLRHVRSQDLGFIFQDPATTLNPVLRVGRQIVEGEVTHGRLRPSEAQVRAAELLREVDIADPVSRAQQYPHQFSGGMRQRAVIAMAMAGKPRLIIADEPTTALDVTVQAQVLSLLQRRQAETAAAVILITHDLGVVAEIAHRVAVMYAGRIVETGTVDEIFSSPRHPYTRALLRSIPRGDAVHARLDAIPGQPPTPETLPAGCPFHPRCVIGKERGECRTTEPLLRPIGADQQAACHFAEEKLLPAEARRTDFSGPAGEKAGDSLLEVDALKVHFPVRAGILKRVVGWVRAVDGVSLTVRVGETVSLVGESGCGKTTTARTIMGLVPATGGDVRFEGRSLLKLSSSRMREARRQMQYVFQDPYAALNPVLPVEEVVAEPLRLHGLYETAGGAARIAELFEMVGLSRRMFGRYPSEFSGGQRQRIGIARALALNPRLLILDEPVSALDVSIQAQVLNLLQDLQKELKLAYLFISHNLSVVQHMSDRVAVMYLGRIVEQAARDEIYRTPTHPYTQSLLSAAPVPDPTLGRTRRRIILEGEIPNPAAPPAGCTFHPRCFRSDEHCRRVAPSVVSYPGASIYVACHHPSDPMIPSIVREQSMEAGE